MKKFYFDDFANHDVKDVNNDDFADIDEIEYKTLLSALRNEVKKDESERGALNFRYKGVDYEGIPMVEVNNSKFGFKLLPKGNVNVFPLSDIIVMTDTK